MKRIVIYNPLMGLTKKERREFWLSFALTVAVVAVSYVAICIFHWSAIIFHNRGSGQAFKPMTAETDRILAPSDAGKTAMGQPHINRREARYLNLNDWFSFFWFINLRWPLVRENRRFLCRRKPVSGRSLAIKSYSTSLSAGATGNILHWAWVRVPPSAPSEGYSRNLNNVESATTLPLRSLTSWYD